MKLVVSLISVLSFFIAPYILDGKTIYIPYDVSVEVGALKVKMIRNLSEIDIFRCAPMILIDDFFYILDRQSFSVIKFSRHGKFICRYGRQGAGPGEFFGLSGISKFKNNIAIIAKQKVIICDKDLNYLEEVKFNHHFRGFVSIGNHVYFYNNPSYFNYYFSLYSDDFRYLKKSCLKKTNQKPKKFNHNNYKYSPDVVREVFYDQKNNGLWASFANRYDLRCYIEEKNAINIKSRKQLFAYKEEKIMGKKIKFYSDYPLLISRSENQLYYCFKMGSNRYCDIFNVSEDFKLQRRLKFPYRYKKLIFYNNSTIYGLRYDSDGGDVYLDMIQINPLRKE